MKSAKSGLFTDFYELTMMQGYFLSGNKPNVVFDMFYRTNPFNSGYAVFAGLNEILQDIQNLSFSENDIAYLRSLNQFDSRFLKYLEDFRFTGDIYAFEEGSVVFPGEPLIRVHADMMQAQLIEGMLLNVVNFQTLIATKASRMYEASRGGRIMEFGLRRAQGPDGAISASRAAYIGGASLTSNTLAGKIFGIPAGGTMAHSWIMSFDNELDAFRRFAEIYPDNCVLLIDTFDTLGSGIENAVTVGLEQKAKGKKIGVRIDSGDLSYLSKEVRKRLDNAGLEDATICVSNDLSESVIETLVQDNAKIDSWGIGTYLVTGGTQSALGGVYKLAAKEHNGAFIPTIKLSNSFEKTTNPGIKQVWRFFDKDNSPLADLIALDDEVFAPGNKYLFSHPFSQDDFFVMKSTDYTACRPMLNLVMKGGRCIEHQPVPLDSIRENAISQLGTLHRSYKRQVNPHIYKVSLSEKLIALKTNMVRDLRLFSD